jgi:hypothetical protein
MIFFDYIQKKGNDSTRMELFLYPLSRIHGTHMYVASLELKHMLLLEDAINPLAYESSLSFCPPPLLFFLPP